MMKFFRKHTKTLLAVFMSLLLIVWLGGTALQKWLTPEDQDDELVIAEAFGKPILQRDLTAADRQTKTLQELGVLWQAAWVDVQRDPTMPQGRAFGLVRQEPLEVREWLMLTVEADQKDVHVPAQAVTEFKRRSGIDGKRMATVRDNLGESLERLDQVIGSFVLVQQQALRACTAAQVSEAEIQDSIRQAKQRLQVSMVKIPIDKLLDKPEETDKPDDADKPEDG